MRSPTSTFVLATGDQDPGGVSSQTMAHVIEWLSNEVQVDCVRRAAEHLDALHTSKQLQPAIKSLEGMIRKAVNLQKHHNADSSTLKYGSKTYNSRIKEAVWQVWPTIAFPEVREAWWRQHVPGDAADFVTRGSKLSLMVATTVFEVTMESIVNAAYLQADKPRDSTVQGLIDKRIAGAYVEPAVYRELHYVGGWIVNRVTEHFGFKLDTVPKQDGPLPLVSDTNAWAYRLCAWCDTSTGRIMPDTEDLAPTQRLVRIQPVVSKFLRQLELLLQDKCLTAAQLLEHGNGLMNATLQFLANSPLLREWWRVVVSAAQLQLGAPVPPAAAIPVLERFVRTYLKSRQRTARIAWELVPDFLRSVSTRTAVLQSSGTTVYLLEKALGCRPGFIHALVSQKDTKPETIKEALSKASSRLFEKLHVDIGKGDRPHIQGQYSITMESPNHGLTFKTVHSGAHLESVVTVASLPPPNEFTDGVAVSGFAGAHVGDYVIYATHNGRYFRPSMLALEGHKQSFHSTYYPMALTVITAAEAELYTLQDDRLQAAVLDRQRRVDQANVEADAAEESARKTAEEVKRKRRAAKAAAKAEEEATNPGAAAARAAAKAGKDQAREVALAEKAKRRQERDDADPEAARARAARREERRVTQVAAAAARASNPALQAAYDADCAKKSRERQLKKKKKRDEESAAAAAAAMESEGEGEEEERPTKTLRSAQQTTGPGGRRAPLTAHPVLGSVVATVTPGPGRRRTSVDSSQHLAGSGRGGGSGGGGSSGGGSSGGGSGSGNPAAPPRRGTPLQPVPLPAPQPAHGARHSGTRGAAGGGSGRDGRGGTPALQPTTAPGSAPGPPRSTARVPGAAPSTPHVAPRPARVPHSHGVGPGRGGGGGGSGSHGSGGRRQ